MRMDIYKKEKLYGKYVKNMICFLECSFLIIIICILIYSKLKHEVIYIGLVY